MRRYIYSGSLTGLPTETFDTIIVGGGLAGIYTALNLPEGVRCLMILKKDGQMSSSWFAQGGIAAVTLKDDNFDLHIRDHPRRRRRPVRRNGRAHPCHRGPEPHPPHHRNGRAPSTMTKAAAWTWAARAGTAPTASCTAARTRPAAAWSKAWARSCASVRTSPFMKTSV